MEAPLRARVSQMRTARSQPALAKTVASPGLHAMSSTLAGACELSGRDASTDQTAPAASAPAPAPDSAAAAFEGCVEGEREEGVLRYRSVCVKGLEMPGSVGA